MIVFDAIARRNRRRPQALARRWVGPAAWAAFLLTIFGALPATDLEAQGRRMAEVDDLVEMGGRSSEWQPSFDATFTPRELGAPATDHAVLSGVTIPSMLQAIDRYAAIVSNGGWPAIPDGPVLHVGVRDDRVLLLRRRLAITGDLPQQAGNATTFDSFVEHAVRRFQFRHGLRPDGAVRDETLRALNVPAIERLRQLRTNVVRINTFIADLPPSYVMVNIPAAEIEAVDAGLVVSRHTAIVGKPDRQTPVLISKIHELNFNPYWHVPQSIVERDIIPQMQQDPTYLERYIIRVYTQKGEEIDPKTIDWFSDAPKNYVFRQDPGEDINSLGAVKLNFHNPFAVFLHDTPQKALFSENMRAYSSGCVRVQNIEQLITWLLKDNDKEYWSRQKIDAVTRSGERVDVALQNPVPLYIVYVTAWASPNGPVQFRNDLYDRDEPGAAMATNN
jgi:murein L,D-transpeptidase YcbB/YkuD